MFYPWTCDSPACPTWKAWIRTVLFYFNLNPTLWIFFPLVKSPFGRSWCHCIWFLWLFFFTDFKDSRAVHTVPWEHSCVFSHPRIHHYGCSIFTCSSVFHGVVSTLWQQGCDTEPEDSLLKPCVGLMVLSRHERLIWVRKGECGRNLMSLDPTAFLRVCRQQW